MLGQARAADPAAAVPLVRLDSRWRTLPFRDGAFDGVVSSSVLEYVPDPAAVLLECARVLRPGGTLLCTVPDVAHPVRWLEWPLGAAARTPLGGAGIGAARRCWPRLACYLMYLRTSRQRRRASWWRAAASGAGLRPATLPGAAARAPLRLLAFTRHADAVSVALHDGGPHGDVRDR